MTMDGVNADLYNGHTLDSLKTLSKAFLRPTI
jgi:hypothetical protein